MRKMFPCCRSDWQSGLLQGLVFSSLLLVLPCALAQDADNPAYDPDLVEEVRFPIKGFEVSGDNPLSSSTTRKLFADLIGPDESLGNIQIATERLERALRVRGFSFYRVSAPPQDLSEGLVRFKITRFIVDSIRVQGNEHFSENNIRRSLPTLEVGESPNTRKLARYLAVANSNPSKETRITVAKGRDKGLIDTIIRVSDFEPRSITAYANNTGTGGDTGDLRLGIGLQHNNLFDRDHIVSTTITTSEEGFDAVRQLGANYQIPLYGARSTLSVFAIDSNIDSGTVAEFFEVSGSGRILGLKYSYFLPKWKGTRQTLSLQFSDKDFDNEIDFLDEPIGVDVRSRPLSLRYQAERVFDTMRINGFAEVTANLSGGSNNTDEAYEATRTGATTDWHAWQIGGSLTRSFGAWRLIGNLHLAESSDRLITGEQFGVGGSSSVRGFEEREFRGDRSQSLSLQMWAPPIQFGIRFGAFVDYARVENNDPVEGEFDSETILSVGPTVAWQGRKNFFMQAGYGYVLDGGESPEALTREDDSKFHISAGKRW